MYFFFGLEGRQDSQILGESLLPSVEETPNPSMCG
jgi:hypothetical protein